MGKIVRVLNVNVVERDKPDYNLLYQEQEEKGKDREIAFGVHGGNNGHARKNTLGIHYGSMKNLSTRVKKDKVDTSSPNFQAYLRGEMSHKEMLRAEKLYWLVK